MHLKHVGFYRPSTSWRIHHCHSAGESVCFHNNVQYFSKSRLKRCIGPKLQPDAHQEHSKKNNSVCIKLKHQP